MRTLPDEVVRPILRFLEDLATPVSLGVSLRLRYGCWEELAKISVSPTDYLDTNSSGYLRDSAAAGILKKYPDFPVDTGKRSRAIEKWYEGERDCYKSNERLARYLPVGGFPSFADIDEHAVSLFEDCRKLIRSWIKDRPPPSEAIHGRHGPGGTYSDKRSPTIADKMASVPTLTHAAWPYLIDWIGTAWATSVAEQHGKVDFVPGNRFTTVPKTAWIDRAIACEPSLNVFYQLAYGRALRERLRHKPSYWEPYGASWDLDHAADVHRKVAMEASVSKEFSTLDLSNASDTVCKNLVRILLPHRWWRALNELRSPKTLIEGQWVVLEKFSSMGNGFTFELETIIFAALACVVSRRCGYQGELGVDVFVFGDDIIVKNDVTRPLRSVLEFCGFSLNLQKSFWGGHPFRESCGADYFDGKPVRPYHLKGSPNGPQDFIAFANGLHALRKRAARNGYSLRLRSWHAVLDALPSRIRVLRGPEGLGDSVIHDDDTSRWRVSVSEQITRIQILKTRLPAKAIRPWTRYAETVMLACATYGTGGGITGGLVPRDPPLGYRIGWASIS